MTDGLKDLPATLPERARARADVTIVVGSPFGGPAPAQSDPPLPLDSYQPAPLDSTRPAYSEGREVIVPSRATVASILEHVRRPPAERLEVETRVASGGMGAIDVAVDRALDRRIAIKTLHPHLRSDDSSVRMFLREARLTGLLDHPHIVPVYEIGERPDDSSLFFAMKLVQGQTLAALAQSLPPQRALADTASLYMLLDVVVKVCDALAFAHSRGVLHCDVKPANVMVGEFGQVFLMDWGIARLISPDAGAPASGTTATGAAGARPERSPRAQRSGTDQAIIGTPCYMSPEQARGDRQHLDTRSDVFLLGATLYELLTRRPPYTSGDRSEALALAAACAFPNPRKVAGPVAVPAELDRIVMKAMAKSPADRYASVADLREDVVRFMRGGAEFPRLSFQPGEEIVREGDVGDSAFILVEGRCEVRKGPRGASLTLKTIGPGDVFGEMAILTEGPRTATVVATEPTTVLVVTSQVLEQEMAALKPWIARLLKSLASRFRELDQQQNRATSPMTPGPERVANQVLMMLTTWGDAEPSGGLSMRWSTLAHELEAQLGVPPMSLFSAIARYGLVLDVEGDRLTVPNPGELRARIASELG